MSTYKDDVVPGKLFDFTWVRGITSAQIVVVVLLVGGLVATVVGLAYSRDPARAAG